MLEFASLKKWLLDNEKYTTEEMELILEALWKFMNKTIIL